MSKKLFSKFITKSEKVLTILKQLEEIAKLPINVLITGETGTGKDLLANEIHNNSLRKNNSFMAINCSSIPENLVESELFGYKKGAFTDAKEDRIGIIESAHKGTLFLDEIGEVNLNIQAKLLRVIENKELRILGNPQPKYVDVRIISATNKNIKKVISENKFRSDLFYRIAEFTVNLLPLKERKEDVPLLADHFIKEINQQFKKDVKGISDAAISYLSAYDFPGNVRELKNLIMQAIASTKREILWVEDFPTLLEESPAIKEKEFIQTFSDEGSSGKLAGTLNTLPALSDLNAYKKLNEIEKEYIEKVLNFTKGNKSKTAQILGITRTTLYEKIKEYKL